MPAKKTSRKRTAKKKSVVTLTHPDAKRKNIPTAEHQSVLRDQDLSPVQVAYQRRNRDLDPQLVWRGKDEQDWSDLVVQAPPLYIQEKVHPKVLIDDLLRLSRKQKKAEDKQLDLFADFNGLPDEARSAEFYQHDANWTNRMILGDSLQVMASLAEREGLRGKVQCIYIDPPYGIKFNSNFQWSTTSRDVKDGNPDHITREPEQVKAFRDTWRDGIHSYLTYLRDRLTVARDLLADSGSIFVQIGDENVHRVRALMDEVFGDERFVAMIYFQTAANQNTNRIQRLYDIILWYQGKGVLKFRELFRNREQGEIDVVFTAVDDISGEKYKPSQIKTTDQISRLAKAGRLTPSQAYWKRWLSDFPYIRYDNVWKGTVESTFSKDKIYVVQTNRVVVERCILMTTDPGDLVLDPTCGSGTTAYVAEQWGRRWITIDTSRVALALARARIMGARYPYYLLADSPEGREKETELRGAATNHQPPATNHQPPTTGSLRQGFVYQRVPHITLKSIANNAEIDVIWERFEKELAPLREELTEAIAAMDPDWLKNYRAEQDYDVELPDAIQEWEVPREPGFPWPQKAATALEKLRAAATEKEKLAQLKIINKELKRRLALDDLPDKPFDLWDDQRAIELHRRFWDQRIARQREIDASIAAHADYEYLYDKPYEDKKKVRVAGPFTVESLSPHRVLGVDENDELIDSAADPETAYGREQEFVRMILDNLKTAGVQQAHKEDKIVFTSLTPWPGDLVCAEGRYVEGDEDTGVQKRAAIFIGPEFGTVSRPDLVAAAREAGDAGFDVLIACAFNYEAHASEFNKLGRIPVLKARMNADLHMADDLKNTGKGNLFVIFGEPDVEVVSGLWLVAKNGRMVANYECVKKLSGLGSLEEINRLGGTDLQGFKRLSAGGEVRPDKSVASSDGVRAVQRRRGSGADGDRRVSPEPERGERIARGSGDAADYRRSAGDAVGRGSGGAAGPGEDHQQDAGRSQALAAIQALRPSDFPLSLTTTHYSQVTIHGVDVFHPNTGEVRSDGPEGIACWFIDTDYNEESFFVRHAYFLGANDPYKALKTTLKAEINEEAWASLHSAISRPFEKSASGRIAVKVINHLGDEVMKVFRIT